MERDFTEQKKNELKQICEITKDNGFWDIGDHIVDLGLVLMDLFSIPEIYHYLSGCKEDMLEYHTWVIEKKDIREKDIDRVFENVNAVDTKMTELFKNLVSDMSIIAQKMQVLESCVNPASGSFTSEGIKKANQNINNALEDSCSDAEIALDKELMYAEEKALEDATKRVVSSICKLASRIVTILCFSAVGGPVGTGVALASLGWDTINSVFDIGTGLVVGGIATAGYWMGRSKNNEKRRDILEEGNKYNDVNGLTSLLETNDDQISETVSHGTKFLDHINEAYKIIKGAIGIKDTVGDKGELKDPSKTLTKMVVKGLEKTAEEIEKGKNGSDVIGVWVKEVPVLKELVSFFESTSDVLERTSKLEGASSTPANNYFHYEPNRFALVN